MAEVANVCGFRISGARFNYYIYQTYLYISLHLIATREMQSIVEQAHILSLPKVITEINYNARMDV